jgi:hypothetical protein
MAASGIYLAADVLVERNGRNVALRTGHARSATGHSRKPLAWTIGCSRTARIASGGGRRQEPVPLRPVRLHRQGEGQDHRTHPPSCRVGRGLPHPDIVITPFSVGKVAAQRGWWSIGAYCRWKARTRSICRGAVDPQSVAKTRGRRTKVWPMTKMIAASTAIPMSSV